MFTLDDVHMFTSQSDLSHSVSCENMGPGKIMFSKVFFHRFFSEVIPFRG